MTVKGAIVGTGWTMGLACVGIVMLGYMLAHMVKNRFTTGKWWT
jgi:hypothetical protein